MKLLPHQDCTQLTAECIHLDDLAPVVATLRCFLTPRRALCGCLILPLDEINLPAYEHHFHHARAATTKTDGDQTEGAR
ncbi:MAG: hypothetical protein IT304_04405 [Dehalococcoidia bacterium]|nr:hypothetical protein [Dehalococcoidia bacterium]